MEHRYELIEHTADIFIKAYGTDIADAFASVAEAMFLQIVDESPIALVEEIELTIEGIDRENLLVAFLSKLIVVHETTGLLLGKVEVHFETDNQLTARGWGEKFDDRKHRHGLMFKAVSYHMMEIMPSTDRSPAHVKVLFDI